MSLLTVLWLLFLPQVFYPHCDTSGEPIVPPPCCLRLHACREGADGSGDDVLTGEIRRISSREIK